ncbi:MAG: nitrous oxide reductase accessory protein NosL [Flavobacteriaceae bacterium]|jgi:copper chaperone NosL|nr:nitrous oxide reductase accessory protein NosL [Flavobacteriaceae bacterium]
MNLRALLSITFFTLLLSSCSKQPRPIEFGVDNCDHCMMNISDVRYGAELVTQKGRIYMFDDMYCMKAFLQEETVARNQVHSLWLVDFATTEILIPAEESFLLYNTELKSPMGSNTAAFADEEMRQQQHSEHSGTMLLWEDYFNSK